jgi:hypothetical protein
MSATDPSIGSRAPMLKYWPRMTEAAADLEAVKQVQQKVVATRA